MARPVRDILRETLREQDPDRVAELLVEFATHPSTQPKTPISIEMKSKPEEVVELFLAFLGNGDVKLGEKVFAELARRAHSHGIKRLNVNVMGTKLIEHLVRIGQRNPNRLLRLLADVTVPERYTLYEGRKTLRTLHTIIKYAKDNRAYIPVAKRRIEQVNTFLQRLRRLSDDPFSPINKEHPIIKYVEEIGEHLANIKYVGGIELLESKLRDAHRTIGECYRETVEAAARLRLHEIQILRERLKSKKRQ